jgi:hypothetical protein
MSTIINYLSVLVLYPLASFVVSCWAFLGPRVWSSFAGAWWVSAYLFIVLLVFFGLELIRKSTHPALQVLVAVMPLAAFLNMTIRTRFLLNTEGTAFIPLIFFFFLGVTVSWAIALMLGRKIPEELRRGFVPWLGFLWISPVALRWRPYFIDHEVYFDLFGYFISLLLVTLGATAVLFQLDQRRPS